MSGAAFVSVRTEGGLLPVDLLRRISLMDPGLPGLRGEDYGLAPGERVADAIVRSWNRLLPIWERFADRLEKLPASETSADTQTRDQWTKWLLDELGFDHLEAARPVVIDDKPYPVSHRAEGVALHLVGARVDMEHRPQMGGRAPHSMVQEFLNRDDDHLWALVTNGLKIRVLRDSSSLTRQAFCEFDLEAIFAGQLYADFALCWLVCHVSRFTGEPPTSCWLQQWSDTARTEGVRALDDLRGGVEQAITALGSGLLTPANGELRRRLEAGELTAEEFKAQILRLVYRLLFLLVAESRDLLADPNAEPEAIERYRESYSMARLVELGRRQRGSLHHDLWSGLRIVFGALAGPGAKPLGLVGLGSFLWSPTSIPDILSSVIPNRALLDAVEHLTSFESGGVRRRVDYKNLGAEELGGVYESLLETHLEIDREGQRVALATAAGNERKTTGSYYTPTPLIKVLLDSALDPVLDEAEQADDPEAAILALKVLDPAAGSGHFLIAAANRIAHRLASVRSGETEPSPIELRHALREVIGRCIYGIDINPMSVELCKVSLWMEATEPGKPLNFLDHRIVCGNSLLGATPALIGAGVPDAAYSPLTGDDRAIVASMKSRNRRERKGQAAFAFEASGNTDGTTLTDGLLAIEALPTDTASQIAEKESRYSALRSSDEANRLRIAADAWCAGFVSRKGPNTVPITTDLVRRCSESLGNVSAEEYFCISELAQEYRFLHLHVVFPDVFVLPREGAPALNERCGWSGGFDAVLGNPPWERVKLQEREWFATRAPEIASAPNATVRKRLIGLLITEHPELHAAFLADKRKAEGESQLLRASGRFPLCGRGDVNTYAVFAELMRDSMSSKGGAGMVVPTGIATGDTTKFFFSDLVSSKSILSLYDFENAVGMFAGVGHGRFKFCLLSLRGRARPVEAPEFAFFLHHTQDLELPGKKFALSSADLALMNPNTRTVPIFRTSRDADITRGIYGRVPILAREGDSSEAGSPWGLKLSTMFHMSGDSNLFRTREDLESAGWIPEGNEYVREVRTRRERALPLYEAKMAHNFTHRWGDYAMKAADYEGSALPYISEEMLRNPLYFVMPRYWIEEHEVLSTPSAQSLSWLIGFRDIARASDERTMIAFVLPLVATGHSLPLIRVPPGKPVAGLLATLCSFALDFVARQKMGGTSMAFFVMNQLPVLTPDRLAGDCPWASNGTALDWIERRVLELVFTAWDLAAFAADLGYFGEPFRWDAERRVLMRAELDALIFRLYDINRSDVEYILETFPIVKRKDTAEFGEYRTKRLILERFDAMAEAEATGVEYQTILDPPPADPSLCHPESTRPDWAKVT